MSVAHRSQVNRAARSLPASESRARSSSSSRTSAMPLAMLLTLSGSTSRAASPVTSEVAPRSLATRGRPEASASMTGRPNVSYKLV